MKRSNHTYFILWDNDKPPPYFYRTYQLDGLDFLVEQDLQCAVKRAFLADPVGGKISLQPWPIAIAPAWLKNHKCLRSRYSRRFFGDAWHWFSSCINQAYYPFYNAAGDVIVAILYAIDEPESEEQKWQSSTVSQSSALSATTRLTTPIRALKRGGSTDSKTGAL